MKRKLKIDYLKIISIWVFWWYHQGILNETYYHKSSDRLGVPPLLLNIKDGDYIRELFSFSMVHHSWKKYHCVKSVRIQSKCGKIQTRITPITDTFHVIYIPLRLTSFSLFQETAFIISTLNLTNEYILFIFFVFQICCPKLL